MPYLAQRDAKAEFINRFARIPKNERRVFYETYREKLSTASMLGAIEHVYPFCHSEAHDLGKIVYRETLDVADAIERCRDVCGGGCFHGVLMEAFSEASEKSLDEEGHVELAQAQKHATEFCEDTQVPRFHKKGKCVHGMGHALAFLADYNLARALDACKLFGDRVLEFYCSGGVFMEYDMVFGERNMQEKPLHYPCDTFTEFPSACYTYKAKRFKEKFGSSQKVAAECMKLDGFLSLGCFRGLGFAYIGEVISSPSRIVEICQFGSGRRTDNAAGMPLS